VIGIGLIGGDGFFKTGNVLLLARNDGIFLFTLLGLFLKLSLQTSELFFEPVVFGLEHLVFGRGLVFERSRK
jgi:hypothetical protein